MSLKSRKAKSHIKKFIQTDFLLINSNKQISKIKQKKSDLTFNLKILFSLRYLLGWIPIQLIPLFKTKDQVESKITKNFRSLAL